MALKFLRSYVLTIAANSQRTLDVDGDYFNILASDQSTFRMGFDNGPTSTMEQGFSGKMGAIGEPYRSVYIENTNASPLNLTVALGYGELWDNKATIDGGVTVAGSGALAADAVSVGDTETEIVGADDSRVRVSLRNVGGATIYLGPSGVTTATGFPLQAGESAELATAAALFGIVAAGTVEVRVLEEIQ